MEAADMNTVEAFMWFFGGIFTYRIITSIINYGHMVGVYNEMLLTILSLLALADENFQKAGKICYNTSVTAGKSEEDLAKEQENIDFNLKLWRNLVIMNVMKMTPTKFRSVLKFNSWNSAMKYLKETRERNVI